MGTISHPRNLKDIKFDKICMGKQIVMSGIIFVKGSGNYQNFHEMCMKVFPNFTTIPFDYLLVSCLG